MRVAICALAWNAHDVTARWLASVRAKSAGHDVKLLLLDNGSQDPERMAAIFASAAPYLALRNEENESIYRGWNRLAVHALTLKPDVVLLSNNDMVVGDGWLDALERELRAGGDRYFLPRGVDRAEDVDELARRYRGEAGPKTAPARAGWCIMLPPRALPLFLPIPEELVLWYGDDFIHDTLGPLGWRCETILDCVAHHATSTSFYARPGYVEIVEKDRQAYARILEGRARSPR